MLSCTPEKNTQNLHDIYVTSKASPLEIIRQKYVTKNINMKKRYNHLKVSLIDSYDRDM